MADGTTTYGDINQRTAGYAAADMLRHAQPFIVLSNMGLTKPMPKNKAEKVIFRRPIPLAAATTPLIEGVTPTAQKISYEDVQVTLKQYGRPIEITDKVTELSEDPVLDTATMLAGEQAGNTIEQVLYGVLIAGTNVFYANGARATRSTRRSASASCGPSPARSMPRRRARSPAWSLRARIRRVRGRSGFRGRRAHRP
jgi:N4-gp56 family major capsid protein